MRDHTVKPIPHTPRHHYSTTQPVNASSRLSVKFGPAFIRSIGLDRHATPCGTVIDVVRLNFARPVSELLLWMVLNEDEYHLKHTGYNPIHPVSLHILGGYNRN